MESISRIFTPPGTDVRGSKEPPVPIDRTDPAIADAERKRRAAVSVAGGFGKSRLAGALGDTGGATSNRTRLVGDIGG